MQIARVIIPNPATIIILLLQGDGNFFAWQQMHEPKTTSRKGMLKQHYSNNHNS